MSYKHIHLSYIYICACIHSTHTHYRQHHVNHTGITHTYHHHCICHNMHHHHTQGKFFWLLHWDLTLKPWPEGKWSKETFVPLPAAGWLFFFSLAKWVHLTDRSSQLAGHSWRKDTKGLLSMCHSHRPREEGFPVRPQRERSDPKTPDFSFFHKWGNLRPISSPDTLIKKKKKAWKKKSNQTKAEKGMILGTRHLPLRKVPVYSFSASVCLQSCLTHNVGRHGKRRVDLFLLCVYGCPKCNETHFSFPISVS